MNFLRRFLRLLFQPSVDVLIKRANELGEPLRLEQMHLPEGYGWFASLRAKGELRYSWTATGLTLEDAIEGVIEQAKEYPIGGKEMMPHAPKLGGKEFDA